MTAVDFSNIFVIVFLAGTAASFVIKQTLEFIDFMARRNSRGKIPEILRDIPAAKEAFSTEKLELICRYENAKYFDWIPQSVCSLILTIALVLSGYFPFLFNKICLITGFPSGILNTFLCFILFLFFAGLPESVLSVPFDLYQEFVTEKKFGFSNMTLGLWIKDQLKASVLSLVLNSILLFAASVMLVKFRSSWWFVLGILLIAFTFLMQIIYPKLIAPAFNRFSPIEEGETKTKIMEVLGKSGFVSDGIFVMDASRRSGHSNAYFTGFGKSKRIVLFDTLVKKLTPDEIAAVLGHEVGHYKHRHILKKLVVMIPVEFLLMFALFKIAGSVLLYNGFGFSSINAENIASVQFIGLFLAMTLFNAVSKIISPILKFSSRKNEYEADAYSAKICGTPEYLISALIKLNSDNLSELFPPKIYVFWNFSHPTLTERVKALRKSYGHA